MKTEHTDKAVFLITIDALRPDHLKSYGYFRNTAPNLEKFVERGSIFLNAFTNGPETPSSFSVMFTSILPLLNGGFSPLPSQKITFPQLLKENGIFNVAIHSNPNLGRLFNYDRGFNLFIDGERYKMNDDITKKPFFKQKIFFFIKKILNYKDLIKKSIYRIIGLNKIKNLLRKKFPILTDLLLPFMPIAYKAPYIVNKIFSILNNFKGPLFLWAHFMDTHDPFNPPVENLLKFRKENISAMEREHLTNKIYRTPHNFIITPDILNKLKDLYDGEINFLDNYLGRLIKFLNFKFKKNCLIIITSDHGESFFEHGFFNHQGNVYDELLKVPLFIIEIGRNFAPKKINETVQLLDIAPTILNYFGIVIPDDFQGNSLLQLIKGKSQTRKNYIISETYQKNGKMKRNNKEGFKLLSIRTDEWKYIFDEEKNVEYLFNLVDDPKESINLVNKYKTKLNEFKKIKNIHFKKILFSNEKSKIVKAISNININNL
ncbi:MAG: sulfatase-like hydrolase/transferase [Promethearchaeota archaeon]